MNTEGQINTPYDDCFRTLINDCPSLLIPLVNEVFSKNYTGKEKVILHPNEHFIMGQDGEEQKRITDSSFTIISDDGREEMYIIEMQSTADDTMLIRIFEYVTQMALESGSLSGNKLTVKIPEAAVIFLRSSRNTPDNMTIEIITSGGSVCFVVPVLKVKDYSLAQIFHKNLYFLLPFYIFNRENRFPVYDRDNSELEKLREEYICFMGGIDAAVSEGKLSAYFRRTILDMSKKVLKNIARKYKNVKTGVDEVMGGRVLEHEGKTIFNEGREEGRREGLTEGMYEGLKEGITGTANAAVKFMLANGMTAEQVKAFMASVVQL